MPIERITKFYAPRSVGAIDAIHSTTPSDQQNSRKKSDDQQHTPRKVVKDYFHPLSKAVEASNQRLIDKKLPYRFRVYKKWGSIYIELSLLDKQGNVTQKQRKNISGNDFIRLIEDVSLIEGLFFDSTI